MGGYSGRSACMTTGCWLSLFAEVLSLASALVFVGFGSFRAFTSETDWIISRCLANGTGCPHPNLPTIFPDESRKKPVGSFVVPGGMAAISSFPVSVASTSPYFMHCIQRLFPLLLYTALV